MNPLKIDVVQLDVTTSYFNISNDDLSNLYISLKVSEFFLRSLTIYPRIDL